jgi:phage terminase Nu1 subunit (DNA packaging protein)
LNIESYCRDIEAYLCRKNDGHLIRISGPAFEQVSKWAEEGIPLKVAYAGIDRYFERYYRRGPRRRPVRIEFCEADVLDAFDDWRRAVGVAQEQQQSDNVARPRTTLAAHVERTVARLTTLRASSQLAKPIDATLERVTRRLDQLLPQAKTARGAARVGLIDELAALDRDLIGAAAAVADPALLSTAEAAARAELASFRLRMVTEAYDRAVRAAVERHLREHFALPTLTFS